MVNDLNYGMNMTFCNSPRSIWLFALTIMLISSPLTLSAARPQIIPADALLKSLCMQSAHREEPACSAPEMTPDQAWTILWKACVHDSTDPCVTFQHQIGTVLVFDSKTREWKAVDGDRKALTLTYDVAGTPTLRLKPGAAKTAAIVVDHISPIAFTATAGTPKEEDVATMTGLKTFLALAGTGIQSVIQTVATSPARAATDVPVAPPASGASTRAFDATKEIRATPKPTQACVANPDVGPLADLIRARNVSLLNVNVALQEVAKELDELDKSRTAFIGAIQRSEDEKPVAAVELAARAVAPVDQAYTNLEKAAGPLTSDTTKLTACQPLLSAFSALLGAPSDSPVIGTLAAGLTQVPDVCTVPALSATVKLNAKRIEDLSTACSDAEQLDRAWKVYVASLAPAVDRLLKIPAAEDKLWQALDKAHSGQASARSVADALNRQSVRGRSHTWNGTLITQLAVARPNPELGWSKVQSHSIVIKADTPYIKEVTLAHPVEETHAYKLESSTGRLLGYGIGVIYTPLHESTWTAVTVPETGTKVIAETKRETRAGDLAAFVSYRFLEHWTHDSMVETTFDIGTSVTGDRPAFFVGPGFEIARAIRFGIGWAPERVSKLSAGQAPNGTKVSSNDDIRTERRFDTHNWYLSFIFALDSLSLFNKP